MACWKAHAMIELPFALIELSSLYLLRFQSWSEMCTTRMFSQGADLLALTFYLDRAVPINHFWHQKIRDSGLSDARDRTTLRSLVLTNTGVWRTDGRICRSIYSACKHMLCCKQRCKILDNLKLRLHLSFIATTTKAMAFLFLFFLRKMCITKCQIRCCTLIVTRIWLFSVKGDIHQIAYLQRSP